MLFAVAAFSLFQGGGGIWMGLVGLTSAGSQLVYAVHCSLASTERSELAGWVYILGAVVWALLWFPAQKAPLASEPAQTNPLAPRRAPP